MGLLQEWGLKNVKRTSVRTALVRLAEEPDVNRVERGVYQFVGASSQTEE